tara:strand:- start:532 stop:735 length:204 start_codon:yes stop_codon:yes gene_type:complete
MQVTKKSQLTGVTRTIDIPNLTEDQVNAWMSGTVIQKAMPHISEDHREFLMTGITPAEWDQVFGDED